MSTMTHRRRTTWETVRRRIRILAIMPIIMDNIIFIIICINRHILRHSISIISARRTNSVRRTVITFHTLKARCSLIIHRILVHFQLTHIIRTRPDRLILWPSNRTSIRRTNISSISSCVFTRLRRNRRMRLSLLRSMQISLLHRRLVDIFIRTRMEH